MNKCINRGMPNQTTRLQKLYHRVEELVKPCTHEGSHRVSTLCPAACMAHDDMSLIGLLMIELEFLSFLVSSLPASYPDE